MEVRRVQFGRLGLGGEGLRREGGGGVEAEKG